MTLAHHSLLLLTHKPGQPGAGSQDLTIALQCFLSKAILQNLELLAPKPVKSIFLLTTDGPSADDRHIYSLGTFT